MVGRTISHYRIVAPLGSGGMGAVYRAEDLHLGRAVALKFVHEDLAHDPVAVQRLRSEARAASALNHPNICTIYEIGEEDGHPFIAMELMTGLSLRDRLAGGRLKVHQVVNVGLESADALDAAHAGGIIHRDVKPGNIFVTDRGHVKVLDFGLAKPARRFAAAAVTGAASDLTASGVTLGTPSYMSPEQATGEELDGRTDLFSLGVVLYEISTGTHPFPGKTSAAILAAILTRAPVAPITLNPELPQRLQDIINNCLEKDRELRYQSAADLRADLKRLRRDLESGHSRAVSPVTRSSSGSASTPASESEPGPTVTPIPAPTPTSTTAPPASPSEPAAPASGQATTPPPRPRARWWLMATAAALALVLLGTYALISLTRSSPPTAPVGSPEPTSSAAPLRENRLALARASLDAGNHRAALAYATEVLALEPTHAEASRIRDEAQRMIARFEAELARARQLTAAGNVPQAARALEQARAIDPTNPSLAEASAELTDRARRDQEAATRRDRGTATSGPPRSDAPGVPANAAPTTGAAPSQEARQPAVPPPAATPPAPAPSVPAAVPGPPPVATPPSSPPVVLPPPARPQPQPPATTPHASDPASAVPVDEDAAIRRVTATYARAIENKDIALFRSVKPNLTGEEERRLREGFRAVTSQEVAITIESIDRKGNRATVRLRRRDTIHASGRDYTTEGQQTVTLARGGDGTWVITDIR